MKPIVAIVGRPNVGKSRFFNYVVGERISIVEDTPGVTRDRVYADSEWRGRRFTLIDTGGIEKGLEDEISKGMREQANIAIEVADVILFMVDVRQGLTSDDKEIANMLRKSKNLSRDFKFKFQEATLDLSENCLSLKFQKLQAER